MKSKILTRYLIPVFIALLFLMLSAVKSEVPKFTVEFDINPSIIHKSLEITITNNQDTSDNLDLKTILKETNFDINEVAGIQWSEWKTVEYNITDYETYCQPYETESLDNESQIVITEHENCTRLEIGSHIEEREEWLERNLIHTEKDGTTEISNQWEQVAIGKAPNNIKKFKLDFNTPIIDIEGWGSKGTIYLEMNSEVYVDKTDSSWWDTNWGRRRGIEWNATNPTARIYEPVEIALTGLTGISKCWELRLIDESIPVEIPYEVLNNDSANENCRIVFLANVSSSPSTNHTIYYDYEEATIPDYSDGGVWAPHSNSSDANQKLLMYFESFDYNTSIQLQDDPLWECAYAQSFNVTTYPSETDHSLYAVSGISRYAYLVDRPKLTTAYFGFKFQNTNDADQAGGFGLMEDSTKVLTVMDPNSGRDFKWSNSTDQKTYNPLLKPQQDIWNLYKYIIWAGNNTFTGWSNQISPDNQTLLVSAVGSEFIAITSGITGIYLRGYYPDYYWDKLILDDDDFNIYRDDIGYSVGDEEVGNTAPVVSTPKLSPLTAYTNTVLTCKTNYTDDDADEGTVYFNWFKNDTNITSAASENSSITSGTEVLSNLLSTNFSRTEVIICQAFANDGTVDSTIVNSTSLTISNSAPQMSTPNITQATAYTNTTLECQSTYYDNDEDSGTVTFQWIINNTNSSATTNTTIGGTETVSSWFLSGNFSKTDQVKCSVHASDGTIGSQSNESSILTISNYPPQVQDINITADTLTNTTLANFEGAYIFYDVDTGDIEQSNDTKWYMNDVQNSSFDNLTYIGSGNTSAGQNWTFYARIHDGDNWSEWANSSTFTIANATGDAEFVSPANWDVSMSKDETIYNTWIIRNDGNDTLTECYGKTNGSLNSYVSFDISNFSLSASESKNIRLTITTPAEGNYIEEFSVTCENVDGNNESTSSNPMLDVTVSGSKIGGDVSEDGGNGGETSTGITGCNLEIISPKTKIYFAGKSGTTSAEIDIVIKNTQDMKDSFRFELDGDEVNRYCTMKSNAQDLEGQSTYTNSVQCIFQKGKYEGKFIAKSSVCDKSMEVVASETVLGIVASWLISFIKGEKMNLGRGIIVPSYVILLGLFLSMFLVGFFIKFCWPVIAAVWEW